MLHLRLHASRAMWASLPFFLPIPYEVHSQPLRIQSIEIVRKNILDQSGQSSTLISDLMNGLHALTSEDVIRRELLFAEGDVYDQNNVEESVRNLRYMGLFSDVSIQTDTLPGDYALIRVVTRERWSLRGAAMVSQEAGLRSGVFGISEDNVLGRGQKVSVYSNYSSWRNNPYGFQATIQERRLFGSRWSSVLHYRNAEEFRLSSLHVERPFYSEDAEWAGGGAVASMRQRIWYDHANPDDERSFRHTTTMRLWYTRSAGKDIKLRWGTAYHHVRTRALPQFLTPSSNLDLVNASIGVMKRDYVQTSFIDRIGTVEYAPTGFAVSAIGGMNLSPSVEMKNLGFFRLGSRVGVRAWKDFVFYSDLSASTYTDFVNVRDAVISWNTSLFQQLSGRHTAAGRLLVVNGISRSWPGYIVLGGLTGLRGYGPNDFTGTGSALLNLEHRFFPEVEVLYFQPGITVFFDSGITWREHDRIAGKRWYSAAGIGLRIANKRFLGSTIIRIDFAYNVMTHQWSQIIFSSDQVFRALGYVETDLPTRTE